MSRNFLDLCKDVVNDLGVAGGTLQSVTGAINSEQRRVIGYVAKADILIQNLWIDWLFLWYSDQAVTVQAGSDAMVVTLPSWAQILNTIEEDSCFQNYGTASARRIPYMRWRDFQQRYQYRAKDTNDNPACYSRDPSGNLILSHKVSKLTTLSLDYHCIGNRMSADSSTSRIPSNFDTIIVERAKMLYAERENAPEIMSGSTAEYTDTLDKMQAVCLPENTGGRRLRNGNHSTPDAYVE